MFNSIGNLLSRKDPVQSKPDGHDIVMLGLSPAGKTSILYRLLLNEFVTTIHTFSFNKETILLRSLSSSPRAARKYTIWDHCGNPNNVRFWPCLLKEGNPVLFVVDSTYYDGFPEARDALHRIYSSCDDRAALGILLVLCNKQDHPDAASVQEIKEKLGMDGFRRSVLHGKRWHIRGVSARTGEGIWEAFDWLDTQLAGDPLPLL
jgi:GTPase SAR1 family protein